MEWNQVVKLFLDLEKLRVSDCIVLRKDANDQVRWKIEAQAKPSDRSVVKEPSSNPGPSKPIKIEPSKTKATSKTRAISPMREATKADPKLGKYYDLFAKGLESSDEEDDEVVELVKPPKRTTHSSKTASGCKIKIVGDEVTKPYVDENFSQGMKYTYYD